MTSSTSTAPEERYFDHQHLTVIEPSSGWRMLDLKELWAYRELLVVLASRDIRVRYKQTVLGAGWAILRPVMTMLVFSTIFGSFAKIPSDGLPYPVFVYCALLPWTFFSSSVGASGGSIVGSANLIGKVYFPRLIVPLSSIGSGLVDLVISTGFLLLLMLWYDVPWTWNLLAAPLLLLAVVFIALGVGILFSAVNVAYRDATHVLPFIIQVWMYATPVIYPVSLVPERYRTWLFLNPLTGLIEGFRSAFLGRPFDGRAIALSGVVAVAVFVAGVAYFERVKRRFADII